MRLGLDKRWFVMPAEPLISRGFYFFLPSFLVGSAIMLVSTLFVIRDPNNNDVLLLQFSVLGFWVLGFTFAYFEPEWLAPTWYRWLKREHGDILPYLEQEANSLGRAAWLKRVQTQEGLEEWVADVRRKHKLN